MIKSRTMIIPARIGMIHLAVSEIETFAHRAGRKERKPQRRGNHPDTEIDCRDDSLNEQGQYSSTLARGTRTGTVMMMIEVVSMKATEDEQDDIDDQ